MGEIKKDSEDEEEEEEVPKLVNPRDKRRKSMDPTSRGKLLDPEEGGPSQPPLTGWDLEFYDSGNAFVEKAREVHNKMATLQAGICDKMGVKADKILDAIDRQ